MPTLFFLGMLKTTHILLGKAAPKLIQTIESHVTEMTSSSIHIYAYCHFEHTCLFSPIVTPETEANLETDASA